MSSSLHMQQFGNGFVVKLLPELTREIFIQFVIITHLPPSVSGAPANAPIRPVTPEQEFSWNNQNRGGHGNVCVGILILRDTTNVLIIV